MQAVQATVIARPTPRPAPITTRELLLWVLAFFSLVGVAMAFEAARHGSGRAPPPIGAVEIIAWGCCFRLLLGDPERHPARWRQVAVTAFLLGAAAVLPGRYVYAALTLVALVVVLGRGWTGPQRRTGFLLFAIAAQTFWTRAALSLFADIVLRIDTAVAGLALRVAVPGSSWSGTILKPPHDIGVTVAMGCSSFANLSLVALCLASFVALDGGRLSWRVLAVAGGIGAVVVMLNTIRLVLVARSLAGFRYWHDGVGATAYGIALTVICVAACRLGSRWAAARG